GTPPSRLGDKRIAIFPPLCSGIRTLSIPYSPLRLPVPVCNFQPFVRPLPMTKRLRLSYYSYDSLGNPWVSGGGAVRDREVLARMTHDVDITLYTARYPGFREREADGIRIRGLGFGRSNAVCRLTYALAANFRILF